MSLKPNIDDLATKVGEMTRRSSDHSTLAFHNRIRAVVKGAGITNRSQAERYFEEVRRACTRHSANARSARAAKARLPTRVAS